MDYTGTGNTLNMRHPHVLQLIMDSLRYWVLEMHVDGFRFDLASDARARAARRRPPPGAFFDIIQQDPVLSQVKLIAEPWDVGEGGYQVGNFPPLWTEWNGKYRDTCATSGAATDGTLGESSRRASPAAATSTRTTAAGRTRASTSSPRTTASRCATSSLQREAQRGERRGQPRRREPQPLVELRRRRADRRPAINALRARQKRNFLATLLLSQGVPMLLGGDEIGRTQQGNNNAYCQDNEISWFDWRSCSPS
jgi:isoamylase